MVEIEKIHVGERLREDFGDIAGLADSIRQFGLLHPIVVDERFNLIAGERRLRAIKSLGWTSIEVKQRGDLSDGEKRLVELEENLRRKDLTEYEKSKKLVELVETAKETLRTDFLAPSAKKQNMEKGRPSKPDSETKVAEFIGVPQRTINEAKHHVKAVEKYPELEVVPKKEAIHESKEFDKTPDKYEEYRNAIQEFPVLKKYSVDDALRYASNLRRMPPEIRAERLAKAQAMDDQLNRDLKKIDEDYDVTKKVNQFISQAIGLKKGITDDAFECWLHRTGQRTNLEMLSHDLDTTISQLMRLRDMVKKVMKGPRRLAN